MPGMTERTGSLQEKHLYTDQSEYRQSIVFWVSWDASLYLNSAFAIVFISYAISNEHSSSQKHNHNLGIQDQFNKI